MNPNKALWEKGDFTRIAESMRESGDALVRGLGITKGLKVLDLGCGESAWEIPNCLAIRDGETPAYPRFLGVPFTVGAISPRRWRQQCLPLGSSSTMP